MRIRFIFSSLVVAALSIASLQGQTSDQRRSAEKDAERQIIQLVFDYWTPKLNDYRRFVDRSLSAPDLTQLNTLRLRFAFLMEEERQRAAAREAEVAQWRERTIEAQEEVASDEGPAALHTEGEQAGDPPHETSAGRSGATSTPVAVDIEEMAPVAVPSNAEVDPHSYGDTDAGHDMNNDRHEESAHVSIGVGADVGADSESGESTTNGAYVDLPDEGDDDVPHLVEESEPEKLRYETSSLAARYGTMSDLLRRRVTEDFASFILAVADLVDVIRKANPAMDDGPDDEELARMRDLGKRRELAEEAVNGGWRELRAFLMLYNGQGLASILAGMGVRNLEGIDMSAASVGDVSENIGHSGVLQNSPNPASTATVVAFRLAEASPKTHLTIFSAHGEAMYSVDLGALGAGEHETTIDVSSYPPGTYVYHLAAQSSMGEEVFSKMMQVVR